MTNDNCSEDYAKRLAETVNENCHVVEGLAMEVIHSQHIPLLNSTSCLSNEDCRIVLNQLYRAFQDPRSVLEMSVILIALTDFISCVSANFETFPLESKKNEKRRISLLILLLQNNWRMLLSKSSEMNVGQMTNIVAFLKRCLERMPAERDYKNLMQTILNMANEAFKEFLKPSIIDNEHLKRISSENIAHHNAANVKKDEPLAATTPRILRRKKENKKKFKKSHDIAKFITNPSKVVLTPCENMWQTSNEQVERNRKRKFHEIEEMLRSRNDEKSVKNIEDLAKDVGIPPSKKHCVHDDFINGKTNAFKVLMKSKEIGKRQQNNSSRCIIQNVE